MELKRIDEVKIEDFDIPGVTLKQVIDRMKFLTKKGYSAWVEEKGDGHINLIFERTKHLKVNK